MFLKDGVDINLQKNKFKKVLVYFLILSLSIGALTADFLGSRFEKAYAANTFYISPDGTDDASHGTGTGVNAWKTLDYALTGSRVAHGDTVNVEAGTYSAHNGAHTSIRPVISGAASSPVTIQAYPSDAAVTFNIPSNGATGFIYAIAGTPTNLHFKNIDFTNTNSKNIMLFWLYGHTLTVENSNIDMNSTGQCVVNFSNDTIAATATLLRTKIQNVGTTHGVVRNARTDDIVPNLNISSSVIYGSTYSYVLDLSQETNTVLKNNTIVHSSYGIGLKYAGGTMVAKNNVFYNRNTSTYNGFFRFLTDATALQDFVDNPSDWDVTNNVWYAVTGVAGLTSNSSSNPVSILPDDVTNYRLDPSFTSSTDFSLTSNTKICGLGLVSALVVGGDFNGEAWTGADIGAYKCPYDSIQIGSLVNKVAFAGDSIMKANGLSETAYDTFYDLTGIEYVDPATSAIPGLNMQGLFGLVDSMMMSGLPNTVFVSIGINGIDDLTDPTAIATSAQYAAYILNIMQKLENWGTQPIWLGIGSANGYNGSDDTKIDEVNALIAAGCVTNGWKHGLYLDQYKFNSNWQSASPDGYYDTAANVHPNSDGQVVIGQLADYLYYTPAQVMPTDEIDIGADARVYEDGKFRNLSTASGSTANLSITPQAGSFTSGHNTAWMDVNIATWDNTGMHNKNWIETGYASGLTNTVHTVGDLEVGKHYYVRVDGTKGLNITGSNCDSSTGICIANDQGKISFTYTGTYSTHTFDVTEVIQVFGKKHKVVASTSSTPATVQTSSNQTNAGQSVSNFNNQNTGSFVSAQTAILQSVLRYLGFFPKDVASTGFFGTITKKALALYQVSRGIVNTIYAYGAGYFGPKTRVIITQEVLDGVIPYSIIIN